MPAALNIDLGFQSTLPRGSDYEQTVEAYRTEISIHAPSRERLRHRHHSRRHNHFNPRSLAGATHMLTGCGLNVGISIHAPSRERHLGDPLEDNVLLFQSTLPRGSDASPAYSNTLSCYFNPRSLAGATGMPAALNIDLGFQSTLPRGSDYEQTVEAYRTEISIHAPSRERH